MRQLSESRSARPPSRYARSAPADAALDRGSALRRLGDYAVAFATAAVHSHLHTRRGRMSIECCDQPEIAQAFLES